MKRPLDQHDIAILSALVGDPRLAASDVGDMVGLSRTAVSRRLTAMRKNRLFDRNPELVSYEEFELRVRAFIEICPNNLSERELSRRLLERPEVLEVSIISGVALCIVEVVTEDLDSLNAFMIWAQKLGSTETKIVFSKKRSMMPLQKRLAALISSKD